MIESNSAILGDCLEVMRQIPDKSIDLILTDLPYGVLNKKMCSWDVVIPLEPLWEQYKRIIKNRCAIVLTATQPFASALIMSNPTWFKYEWIWSKGRGTGFQMAKHKPLNSHENILVFGKEAVKYNPQMRDAYERPRVMKNTGSTRQMPVNAYAGGDAHTMRYPITEIYFENGNQNKKIHPTQKPVKMFEFLIKTYTDEGALVLDSCAGGFTTAIAAMNTGRNYICIEKDETYYQLGKERIAEHCQPI